MTEESWQVEGKARFQIKHAFYRPQSQIARDLGVLAACVYRGGTGRLRVLDAMAGSGVRSLRYYLEGGADWVWANDSNPEVSTILEENLKQTIAAGQYQVTHRDANQIFFECYNQRNFYDLIDVDSFGSPAPYLQTCLWAAAIGGLLYITSTDGRSATGHAPNRSLSTYGAYARAHPAAHEQGLRLLIGSIQQSAAAKGFGVIPIFSLFNGETHRVMLRLVAQSRLDEQSYGFLGYCQTCGNYQTASWRKLGRVECTCGAQGLTLSGPVWLGSLHKSMWLQRMIAQAEQWQWNEQIKLLQIMMLEADLPPYFYTLGEIGRRGKIDLPKRSHLIQTLQHWGYRAAPTHIDAQAIKTDASLEICIKAAQALQCREQLQTPG